MSRIIVKNLPSRVKEAKLREQFSKCGVITDLKLMKTQRGVFRRFAFIGYSSEDQAQSAVDHFNKTFINASKIEVELAKPYGDDSLNRPWSKYSKGSSAFNRREKQVSSKEKQKPSDSEVTKEDTVEGTDGKPGTCVGVGGVEWAVGECEGDPAFQEFLDAHKHKGKVWADGTSDQKVKGQSGEERKNETGVGEVLSEEESDEVPLFPST